MSFVSAATSIWAANKQSGAAEDAAATQARSAAEAMAIQKQMYDQQRADAQPWMQAGQGALGQMQDMTKNPVSFTGQDFQNNMDPAYAFDLQQGQQALERSAAARGGLMSGGTMKDLTKYAQGMASNEYQNAYGRFMNNQNTTFNRLGTIAGYGQNTLGMNNAASQHYGTTMSDLITGAGNAAAGNQIAQGNIWGSTISGMGQMIPQRAMQAGALAMGMPGGLGGGKTAATPPAIPSTAGAGALTMPQFGSQYPPGAAQPSLMSGQFPQMTLA